MGEPTSGNPIGQGLKGPYDPRKKESSRFSYFKAVQADLNKRFSSSTGMKKKNKPTKEK